MKTSLKDRIFEELQKGAKTDAELAMKLSAKESSVRRSRNELVASCQVRGLGGKPVRWGVVGAPPVPPPAPTFRITESN